MNSLQPISTIPFGSLRALFSDLDGTLTIGQRLPAAVHQAFERLETAGIPVVIVSGRPAGWADCLARLLPLTAVIFENGAGVYRREGTRIVREDLAGDPKASRARLQAVFQEMNDRFGPLQTPTDQPFRLFDAAIDIREEVTGFTDERVEQMLKALRAYPDLTVKLSSIHINYWVGKYDKRTAAQRLFQSARAPFPLKPEEILFCGDSPNDEPLFQLFPHAVGMKNLQPYLKTLSHPPRFLAEKEEGDGFLAVIEKWLNRSQTII